MTNKFMNDPVRILVKRDEITLDGIKQFFVAVEKDDYTYHVLITSTGRKVEAVTLINYIKTKIHYPDGTDYVMRQRKIKPKRQGKPAFPSSISNKVYFRGQTGNIKTNRKATS